MKLEIKSSHKHEGGTDRYSPHRMQPSSEKAELLVLVTDDLEQMRHGAEIFMNRLLGGLPAARIAMEELDKQTLRAKKAREDSDTNFGNLALARQEHQDEKDGLVEDLMQALDCLEMFRDYINANNRRRWPKGVRKHTERLLADYRPEETETEETEA